MQHGTQERPTPYLVADRKEWIVCDEPTMAGLAIYVRTDITHAEQAVLKARWDEIVGPASERWFALPADERDLAASPKAQERALLAPYVFDWNAQGRDPDGNPVELAPPAVSGPAVFDAISREEEAWITRVIIHGYYVLGKAGRLPVPPEPSGSGSTASKDDADLPPAARTPRRRNARQS